LLSLLKDPDGKLALTDIGKKLKRAGALARSLEQRGLVRIEKAQAQRRHPCSREVRLQSRTSALSAEQKVALREVVAYIRDPENSRPILLYGATGSGKTEVYLGAIEETLRLG